MSKQLKLNKYSQQPQAELNAADNLILRSVILKKNKCYLLYKFSIWNIWCA